MKKTLLAIAIGALAITSTASANWYVQGDLGLSKIKINSDLSKTKVDPRFSVGYDFGEFRLAADYTHYGKLAETQANETLDAKIYGLGLSVLYDIDIDSEFTPYIGARLASNVFKITNTGPNFLDTTTQAKLGYGVIAGAQYKLANNLSLNGALEYNTLGHFNGDTVTQYGAKVGLRYEF